MTHNDDRYDHAIRQYTGVGRLQHHILIEPVDCKFAAYQQSDGTIRLRCEAVLHESWRHLRQGPQVNLSLEGTTNEGQRFVINGPALIHFTQFTTYNDRPSDPVVIRYVIHGFNRIAVGVPELRSEAIIRFALVNFRFMGNEAEEIDGRGTALNVLKLYVADSSLIIRKSRNYKQTLEQLEELGGSCITCVSEAVVRNLDDIERIEEIMDNLCRLFSIASGTLVSWLYFDLLSNEGNQVYSVHRPSVTRNFVSQPLIDPRQMNDIKYFVESTYDNYVRLTSTHRMIQVVSAFTDTRSNNFLETRGLMLVALVEYLTGLLADSTGNNTLIPLALYDNGKDKFKKLIIDAAKKAYSGIDKDTLNDLVQHCLGNFQTFRRKIKLFRKEFQIPISNGEIDRFVNNRNDLAHRATFHTSDEYGELSSMIYVLDRMILRLLGYSGPYLNYTTWEREELKPSGA